MMRNKKAFSLLELLIALSLSSLIILGLLQSYRSLVRYLGRSKELIGINRRVCLLFNQMERDFMTAFIPQNFDDPGEGDVQSDKNSSTDVKKDGQKKFVNYKEFDKKYKFDKKNFFLAEADENQLFDKIQGKKMVPFKLVTFVNSNPLQIFGQYKIRYVRVMYSLEENKERSTKGKVSYNLIRKESRDIENVSMKISEFDYEKQKSNPISSHIIAEDVKAMYVEYVGVNPQKKDGKKENKFSVANFYDGEEIRGFSWGDKDFTQGMVPKRVEVTIELWDEQLKHSYLFQAVFPVLSFPTIEEVKRKDNLSAMPTQASRQKAGAVGHSVRQLPPGLHAIVNRAFSG